MINQMRELGEEEIKNYKKLGTATGTFGVCLHMANKHVPNFRNRVAGYVITENETAKMVNNVFPDKEKSFSITFYEKCYNSNMDKANEKKLEPYLSQEELEKRRISFLACEDEENCGFLVEFKFPNCTFFFCKEHKMGFNIDLNTVNEAGVECKQHGKMERYDVLREDNICPVCKNNMLAILSVGVN